MANSTGWRPQRDSARMKPGLLRIPVSFLALRSRERAAVRTSESLISQKEPLEVLLSGEDVRRDLERAGRVVLPRDLECRAARVGHERDTAGGSGGLGCRRAHGERVDQRERQSAVTRPADVPERASHQTSRSRRAAQRAMRPRCAPIWKRVRAVRKTIRLLSPGALFKLATPIQNGVMVN